MLYALEYSELVVVMVMVMVIVCPEGVILEIHCPSYIPIPIAIETVW